MASTIVGTFHVLVYLIHTTLYEVNTVIILILQMKKVKPREVK